MFVLDKRAFSALFHVSIPTIDEKNRDGKWIEGEQFVRDPDGRIHILLFGYQQWVMSKWQQQKSSKVALPPCEENSFSGSGGTTPTRARANPTVGRSRHITPIPRKTVKD